MGVLLVPQDPPDAEPYPTLGPALCDLLEERSVFGPGSLKGLPYVLDMEKRAAIYKAYEVFPRGHELAGRRRFKRVGLSWRKGTAKTEWAAQVCWLELHPESPVRCDGWDANGNPVGRPVRDPYIPMLAFTEDQAEELAFGALVVICQECSDADYFDVGLERILRLDTRGRPDGKAVALAGSPNANDGARTTFQHFDETHRMELPRLVQAHRTMLANIPKRPLDDPWSLETTTAGRPGGGSVAEATHRYAHKIELGEVKEPRMFFFHREAGPHHKLTTMEGRIKAVAEATGPVGEYAPGQFAEIAAQWDEPDADRAYLERVWLNRWTQSASQAFDVKKFRGLSTEENKIPSGAFCTLGFDGARFRDSTAFVLTEIESGRQELVALWERPIDIDDRVPWEVPVKEVEEKFKEIFKTYKIHMLYADPPHWVESVANWAGEYPDNVMEWWTHIKRKVYNAIRAYNEAINGAQVHPLLNDDFIRHVGNAGKVESNLQDEDGKKIYILGKLRPEAKFDACMAAILSWQARIDAIGDGAAEEDMFVPIRVR